MNLKIILLFIFLISVISCSNHNSKDSDINNIEQTKFITKDYKEKTSGKKETDSIPYIENSNSLKDSGMDHIEQTKFITKDCKEKTLEKKETDSIPYIENLNFLKKEQKNFPEQNQSLTINNNFYFNNIYSPACIVCKNSLHLNTNELKLVSKNQPLTKQQEYKLLLLWFWGLRNNKYFFNRCTNCTNLEYLNFLKKEIEKNKTELLTLDQNQEVNRRKRQSKKYLNKKKIPISLVQHQQDLDNKLLKLKNKIEEKQYDLQSNQKVIHNIKNE